MTRHVTTERTTHRFTLDHVRSQVLRNELGSFLTVRCATVCAFDITQTAIVAHYIYKVVTAFDLAVRHLHEIVYPVGSPRDAGDFTCTDSHLIPYLSGQSTRC